MKKLFSTLILALTVPFSYALEEFVVNKVIPVSSFTITKEEPYFVIWREVCSDFDVKVEVYKKWISLDGKDTIYLDNTKADYGFIGMNTCRSGAFPVDVPAYIPNGEYKYTPVVSVNGDTKLISIPTEIIVIDR